MPRLLPLTALRLTFALNGVGIAVWFPRIPDVKAALEVDLLTLSLCFFMLPIGTMLSFFFAPPLMARFGARRLCQTAGPAFILFFMAPAFAGTALQLGMVLFLAGLTVGSIEVAMNTKTTEMERTGQKRIMASCHGAWSGGSMAGALIGGAAAGAGISFLHQQLAIAPLLAALAVVTATCLPEDLPADASAGPPRLRLPKGALLAVCILPLGALLLEGAMMEWSALFLRGDVGLGPFAASVVFAAFSLIMAIARFLGDPLIERLGAAPVLAGSCILAGIGTASFALAPNLTVALPAAVILGAGIANIYPLAMSRAGEVPGAADANIATVAVCSFTAFMIGPPFIGAMGSQFGLPTALLLLTPLGLYPLVMLRRALSPDT